MTANFILEGVYLPGFMFTTGGNGKDARKRAGDSLHQPRDENTHLWLFRNTSWSSSERNRSSFSPKVADDLRQMLGAGGVRRGRVGAVRDWQRDSASRGSRKTIHYLGNLRWSSGMGQFYPSLPRKPADMAWVS